MDNNKRKWVALYSQTGSEIKNLIEKNRIPDIVYTDNWRSHIENIEYFKSKGVVSVFLPQYMSSRAYDSILNSDDLVTLHGWLNIIPGDICDKYCIYNGHPGLITKYPELKGRDPQHRVWINIDKYDTIGSVIHAVTADVDDGQVIVVAPQELKNLKVYNEEYLIWLLSKLSIYAWMYFFDVADSLTEYDMELDYNGNMKVPSNNDLPFYVY